MKSESAKGMNELISEERHRLTLEALADVDSGNVIDRQAIQAWAVSVWRPIVPCRYQKTDVRRNFVGHYEKRYAIKASTVYVLRLWYTREDR